MSFLPGVRFLAVFGFGLVSLFGANAGELPILEAGVPGEGERVSTGANVFVHGSVRPSFNTHVVARVYHVQDDGGLLRLAGCTLSLGKEGKFVTLIDPPVGNWIPGRTRVRVSLANLPQVIREFEFHATGPGHAVPLLPPAYDPPASDLVVRMPLEKVHVYELLPRAPYLVEGKITLTTSPDKAFGASEFPFSVLARISRPRSMVAAMHGQLAGKRRNHL